MIKVRFALFLVVVTLAFIGLGYFEKRKETIMADGPYLEEVEKFRAQAEERLRSPDGWLSVVGLTWLKDGSNVIGAATENDVVLPTSVSPKLGRIDFSKEQKAIIEFFDAKSTTVDEQPVKAKKRYELADDRATKATVVRDGTVSFFLIRRKNGVGVRIKDSASEARKSFQGRRWYPVDADFKIEADWVAHPEPQLIQVPDILGNLNEEKSPGFARFVVGGQSYELHPTQEGEKLFYVFRDLTSGKETYGAARFVYSDLPQNGKVTLDFNKAVNPPCAFTAYATCPMPPAQNILMTAVTAGELKPSGSTH